MAGTSTRQVEEIQIRLAVLNLYTVLGPSLTLPDLLDALVRSGGYYATGQFSIKNISLTPSLYDLVHFALPRATRTYLWRAVPN